MFIGVSLILLLFRCILTDAALGSSNVYLRFNKTVTGANVSNIYLAQLADGDLVFSWAELSDTFSTAYLGYFYSVLGTTSYEVVAQYTADNQRIVYPIVDTCSGQSSFVYAFISWIPDSVVQMQICFYFISVSTASVTGTQSTICRVFPSSDSQPSFSMKQLCNRNIAAFALLYDQAGTSTLNQVQIIYGIATPSSIHIISVFPILRQFGFFTNSFVTLNSNGTISALFNIAVTNNLALVPVPQIIYIGFNVTSNGTIVQTGFSILLGCANFTAFSASVGIDNTTSLVFYCSSTTSVQVTSVSPGSNFALPVVLGLNVFDEPQTNVGVRASISQNFSEVVYGRNGITVTNAIEFGETQAQIMLGVGYYPFISTNINSDTVMSAWVILNQFLIQGALDCSAETFENSTNSFVINNTFIPLMPTSATMLNCIGSFLFLNSSGELYLYQVSFAIPSTQPIPLLIFSMIVYLCISVVI